MKVVDEVADVKEGEEDRRVEPSARGPQPPASPAL